MILSFVSKKELTSDSFESILADSVSGFDYDRLWKPGDQPGTLSQQQTHTPTKANYNRTTNQFGHTYSECFSDPQRRLDPTGAG
jgi:hypothetical protein